MTFIYLNEFKVKTGIHQVGHSQVNNNSFSFLFYSNKTVRDIAHFNFKISIIQCNKR